MSAEQSYRKLSAQLALERRVEGDRLLLPDAVMLAALDSSRALSASEAAALSASPLTMRRFKTLAQERSAAFRSAWQARGMLRAAADGAPLATLATDDGHWTLHFVEHDGAWRVILALAANAPFAARLLRQMPLLRVVDGQGATILQGRVDSDGECEAAWPFASAPAVHLQQAGAVFAVQAAEL